MSLEWVIDFGSLKLPLHILVKLSVDKVLSRYSIVRYPMVLVYFSF